MQLNQKIEEIWKLYLGHIEVDFSEPLVHVFPHGKHYQGYNGAFLFMREKVCLVSLPPEMVGSFSKFRNFSPTELFQIEILRREFGDLVEKIIGPAYYGYASKAHLIAVDATESRLLNKNERPLLNEFSLEIDKEDWESGGLNLDTQILVGIFSQNRLVALAGYDIWEHGIGHIGIVCHPAYRGKGYGKKALSALSEYGTKQGLIMQYRTARTNTSSIAIAQSVGFIDFASSIAVRFKK